MPLRLNKTRKTRRTGGGPDHSHSALIADKLFKQMARWTTAAEQDTNPIIAVLHANYGAGFMMALREIAGDEELGRMLGVRNIRAVFQNVQKVQTDKTLRLVAVCPASAPATPLAAYAGESVGHSRGPKN